MQINQITMQEGADTVHTGRQIESARTVGFYIQIGRSQSFQISVPMARMLFHILKQMLGQ